MANSFLTQEQYECLKKLALFDTADFFDTFGCERMIEQLFPGIWQEVGVMEHLPPLERYLLCNEIFFEILKSEDGEKDELLI